MPSYLCRVFYLGTNYYGSQIQPGLPTIQGELIDAISRWSGETHSEESVRLAGRTDRGVHSIGQLVLIRTGLPISLKEINKQLPDDITLWAFRQVPSTYEPRFEVLLRHYLYCLEISSLSLDLGRMCNAARMLIGTHDYSSLAKQDGNRPMTTTLLNIDLSIAGNVLLIDVYGTGFLWNLVRRIVTFLMDVGVGLLPDDAARLILDSSPPRRYGNRPSYPEGLILVESAVPLYLAPDKGAIKRIRKTIATKLALYQRLSTSLTVVDWITSMQLLMA
ncbi:MAG: tRNA pseudouridine(38-40) synthase TruA [Candidatus Thorarchaeota archaeon]